jgi:hypothetical protein
LPADGSSSPLSRGRRRMLTVGSGLKKDEDVARRTPAAAATALANQDGARACLEAAGRPAARRRSRQWHCLSGRFTVAPPPSPCCFLQIASCNKLKISKNKSCSTF